MSVSDFDPERIFYAITKAGDTWCDRQAAADLLEETRKVVLAELMNGLEGSGAERERKALADPVYRLHVTNMVTARKEANRARMAYDAVRVLSEMRRSAESTRRAEMQIK